MKRTFITLFVALGLLQVSQAAVTINLSAGTLFGPNTSSPLPPGTLVQLVASTLDNTFTTPSVGSFTGNSSDDLVLMSFVTNDFLGTSGSVQQTISFTLSGNLNPGDQLILRWFPGLTLTSTSPTSSSQTFGQFRTDLVENGSDIAWIVPQDNTLSALNFLTVSSFGTRPDTDGLATMVVAIPEPSTLGLLMVGLAGVGFFRRRAKTA